MNSSGKMLFNWSRISNQTFSKTPIEKFICSAPPPGELSPCTQFSGGVDPSAPPLLERLLGLKPGRILGALRKLLLELCIWSLDAGVFRKRWCCAWQLFGLIDRPLSHKGHFDATHGFPRMLHWHMAQCPPFQRGEFRGFFSCCDCWDFIGHWFQVDWSWGHLQDGKRLRRGDQLPPHKYIKTTSTCGTSAT